MGKIYATEVYDLGNLKSDFFYQIKILKCLEGFFSILSI